MSIQIIQVDAFTATPFGGNPAAIALLDDERDDAFLQALAAEMNLSETAFPVRRPDGDWDLRWFTPTTEVSLCGHATLGAAHVLLELGLVTDDEITFHTRSGPLACRRSTEGIVMDFPAAPAEPCPPVAGLDEALGATVVDQGRSLYLLAELESADAVAELDPAIDAIAAIDATAVVATAAGNVGNHVGGGVGGGVGGEAADFVSRVFAPRVGIAEDPVTGSAHCITGPWWAERLGRADLAARQLSPRGGTIGVRVLGSRVELTGQAVTVFTASLTDL